MKLLTKDGHAMVSGNAGNVKDKGEVGGNGNRVVEFGIAAGKDADGKTEWVNVAAWNQLGEVARTLNKGDPVFVTGRVREREHDGKTYRTVNAEYTGVSRPLGGFLQTDEPPPEEFGTREREEEVELPF